MQRVPSSGRLPALNTDDNPMEHRRSPLKLPLHSKRATGLEAPEGVESPRKRLRFDFDSWNAQQTVSKMGSSIKEKVSEKLEGLHWPGGWHAKLLLMILGLLSWEIVKAAIGMSKQRISPLSLQVSRFVIIVI